MKYLWIISVMLLASGTAAMAAPQVYPVVDTGAFEPNEMTVDHTTGDVYLNGFAGSSTTLSIWKASSSGMSQLYAALPATTGGNLQYTNGFAVDGTHQLWWNNANAGPGSATEFSRAPAVSGGIITRNSPTDDIDSLSWSGTKLFAAYYQGALYVVDAIGNLSGGWFHRISSHLCIVGAGSLLYVADDSGAYRLDSSNGAFTDIVTLPNTFRTDGSRCAVDAANLYVLDRNVANGFWIVPLTGATPSFVSNPLFTSLNAIAAAGGYLYVADTGNAGNGHVWLVNTEGGTQGPAGPKGDKGDTGAQGLKGDTGAQGLKGDTGAQGLKGDTGAQGLKGDTGAQGLKGDTGAQGLKGDTGDTGSRGLKGDTGASGTSAHAAALAGSDPRCGGFGGYEVFEHDPLTSADTSVGVVCNGATGAIGPQGPPGSTGPQGAIGSQGIQGPAGPAFTGQVIELVSGSPAPAGFTLIGRSKSKIKDGDSNAISVDVYRKN